MNHLKILMVALPLLIALYSQNESCGSSKTQPENTKPQIVNTTNVRTQREESMTRGTWGGNHVSMEVSDEGARIEYACAHGAITEPIRVDREGKFSAKGTHVQERGGPIREGSQNAEQVVYSGTIDGKTLTLTVTKSSTDEVIGTFTLTLGKVSRIRKCL